MDIKELRKKAQPIEYVTIKARVQKDHLAAADAAGFTPDIIAEHAYKEVYEQLAREGAIKSFTPTQPIVERVPQVVRGEWNIEPNIKERILALMKPGENFYSEELIDRLRCSNNAFYKAMGELHEDEEVASSDTRPKRYWLKKSGDPNVEDVKDMLPAKTSYMG